MFLAAALTFCPSCGIGSSTNASEELHGRRHVSRCDRRVEKRIPGYVQPPVAKLWSSKRPTEGSDNNDDFDENEAIADSMENDVSRRVFLLGVSATSLFTLTASINFFGDDAFKRRLSIPFRTAFPFFFAKETILPTSQRLPLDEDFSTFYFKQHANIAVEDLNILTREQLGTEESQILSISRFLFFPKYETGQHITDMTDPLVYSYFLYARVHTIALHTSPASRRKFTELLGQRTYHYIRTKCQQLGTPLPDSQRARQDPRQYAGDWLLALRLALATLVRLGWISSFTVNDFDSASGSMWDEEGRGELTVACNDPVTLGTAMLLGEESYEEISPKPSALVSALLADFGVANLTAEDYYMDLMYRPDPAMYKPRQIVTQYNFNIARQ